MNSRRRLDLFVLVSAVLIGLAGYLGTMLTVSLPDISSQYDVSISEASLILALYAVTGIASVPLIGKFGDVYGKKKTLTATLVVFAVSTACSAFVNSFVLLLITRAIQGIGTGIFVLVLGLVVESYPKKLVPRKVGLLRSILVAGGALGFPVGAYITSLVGWQGNYRIVFPVVIILSIISLVLARESPNLRREKIDIPGGLWLGASMALIVTGLAYGSTWGWTSPRLMAILLIGLLSLIPLFLYERKVDGPVLDIGLLAQRNVLISTVLLFVVNFSMYLSFQSLTYEFQLPVPSGFGVSIISTGLYILPLGIMIVILSYPVGMLISKYGVKPFLYLGSLISALGFYMLSTGYSPLSLSEYLTIVAVGLAFLTVAGQNLLILSVRKSDIGLANGLNTSFSSMGRSIGAPIAASVLTTFSATYVSGTMTYSMPTLFGFRTTYFLAVAFMLISAIMVAFSREVIGRKVKMQAEEEPNVG